MKMESMKMAMKMKMAMAMKMRKMAMKKSVIAKGKRAKVSVFKGSKVKTASGLKKSDLKKNKNGKIVSVKKSAAGKKAFKRISGWNSAVNKARKPLGLRDSALLVENPPPERPSTPRPNLSTSKFPNLVC